MTLAVVTIHGRLGKDPDHRTTPGGTEVCNLRLAVTPPKSAKERGEETLWLDAVAFGFNAAGIGHLRKGDEVMVVGRLADATWIDREGNKRPGLKVIADRVVGARYDPPQRESAPRDDGGDRRPAPRRAAAGGAAQAEPRQEDFDDPIPF